MEEKKLLEEGIDFPYQTGDWDEADCGDEVTQAATKAFGIKYLFPWQRIVIANILDAAKTLENHETAAEDIEDDAFYKGKQIVLLPTGAGKSLCFLSPALVLKGATLVLYPLIALMNDQKRRMDEGGLKSVVFKGGQTSEERENNFKEIENGAKIILANPEVLQNEKLVERLSKCNIIHAAIDEAHCVSEWGDSFRPAYLTVGKIIKKLSIPIVTAFTATASPEVLNRVSEVLFEGSTHIVRSESDRQNIHYEVINCFAKKRKAFELALFREKPLLIFCGTRKKSEDMARELAAFLGEDKVKFYHAGLSKEEKTAVEKWFYPKTDGILCCTCAFGMGVDKKDIKTVIHLEASPTAESYIQEAGRGGRDGSVANAVLLWSFNDSLHFGSFKKDSRNHVMKDFAESKTCRRQVLLDALGGELAYCSGCDICKNGHVPKEAEDAQYVLKTIKFNNKVYDSDELSVRMMNHFNEKSGYEKNVWTSDDCEEIIDQLIHQKKIHKCSWPWKYKIGFGKKSRMERKISFFLRHQWLHLRRLIQKIPLFWLLHRWIRY